MTMNSETVLADGEGDVRVRETAERVRTNFVLIDFENVQPEMLAQVDHEHFKVLVFVGSAQTKVAFEIASPLQRMGNRAEYIKISGSGRDALDFHLAFYVGQFSATHPGAFFHIISKDTGYDPLIDHLKTRKILAARWVDVADIPSVKTANAKTPEEWLQIVIKALQQPKMSKPQTKAALLRVVIAMFQKRVSEKEAMALISQLIKRNVIGIANDTVTYLPTSNGAGTPLEATLQLQ